MNNYICFQKDNNVYNNYLLTRDNADGWWKEDTIFSVAESYEFYKDYTRTRENINEVDWDIVSVRLDEANIDFIREFSDFIRWDLVDSNTYFKWKNNNDPRYKEFKHKLEDTEITGKSLDDEWCVKNFIREILKYE